MAIELTASTSTSRRTLLTGLVGGLAAAVAGTLGRAQPASARDPDDVRKGGSNSTTNVTTITNTAAGGSAFLAIGTGSGAGVTAFSTSGNGVVASTTSGFGVYGFSSSGTGVWAASGTGTGVFDVGGSSTLPAVVGHSTNRNTGVQGYSGNAATLPVGQGKRGVEGYADTDDASAGVRGTSPTGRGGIFKGPHSTAEADPCIRHHAPTSGDRGDLYVDTSGRLWFCKGSTTWVQLA
jgi:hypothetical protein